MEMDPSTKVQLAVLSKLGRQSVGCRGEPSNGLYWDLGILSLLREPGSSLSPHLLIYSIENRFSTQPFQFSPVLSESGVSRPGGAQ